MVKPILIVLLLLPFPVHAQSIFDAVTVAYCQSRFEHAAASFTAADFKESAEQLAKVAQLCPTAEVLYDLSVAELASGRPFFSRDAFRKYVAMKYPKDWHQRWDDDDEHLAERIVKGVTLYRVAEGLMTLDVWKVASWLQ